MVEEQGGTLKRPANQHSQTTSHPQGNKKTPAILLSDFCFFVQSGYPARVSYPFKAAGQTFLSPKNSPERAIHVGGQFGNKEMRVLFFLLEVQPHIQVELDDFL